MVTQEMVTQPDLARSCRLDIQDICPDQQDFAHLYPAHPTYPYSEFHHNNQNQTRVRRQTGARARVRLALQRALARKQGGGGTGGGGAAVVELAGAPPGCRRLGLQVCKEEQRLVTKELSKSQRPWREIK